MTDNNFTTVYNKAPSIDAFTRWCDGRSYSHFKEGKDANNSTMFSLSLFDMDGAKKKAGIVVVVDGEALPMVTSILEKYRTKTDDQGCVTNHNQDIGQTAERIVQIVSSTPFGEYIVLTALTSHGNLFMRQADSWIKLPLPDMEK